MHILDSSNRVTYGTKITDRIWRDNNGQLICRDCIIARTGYYDYLESDVEQNGDPNKIVKVYRPEEEVFDPVSIASFENKPLCNDHPEEDVTPENYRDLQCGFMRNVCRGKGDLSNCLMCDVVITDPDVISLVESGEKRELSLGYDTDIVKRNGEYVMTHIRGNHLALVDSGRAGCASIRDNAIRFNKKIGGTEMLRKFRTELYDSDEDILEVEELKPETDSSCEPKFHDEDEVVEVEELKEEPTSEHDEISLTEVLSKLDEILAILKPAPKTTDEDDVTEKETTQESVEKDEDIQENEDEDKLLDADKDLEEETEDVTAQEDEDDIDEDVDESSELKNKDSKFAYSKFAKSKIEDSADSECDITKIFQSRYDRAAGIRK